MSSNSKGNSIVLSRRYGAALRKQLVLEPGMGLPAAGRLGCEALAAGLSTLDLVRIHERTVVALRRTPRYAARENIILKRAARFLVEALLPFENAHRAARKSNGQVSRLKLDMRQRGTDLLTVRRQLKREISRREAAQKALKSSEQHYGELLAKSRRMQDHLQRLSHEVLYALEQERKKISRELHDEIGQTLTAINVKLATLRKAAVVDSADLKKRVASTQKLVEMSMRSVHRFARELRPPLLDELGLIPALQSYLRGFTERTRIPVEFTAFAAIERLHSDKRTVLYRVAQEAITNIDKHARATRIEVRMRRLRGQVRMEIHDDGRSFQSDSKLLSRRIGRLGLLGMRERIEMVGGQFAVESEPGKGTTIRAQIPFANGPRRRRSLLMSR